MTRALREVFGHERQFLEVFQILIRNSFLYKNVEPSRITITATVDGTSCTVCLRDNGIGFDPEFRQQIFEPFKRPHGSEMPGAGLGLSICKKIVEAHGGCIWAESQPGHGAAFYLEASARPNLTMSLPGFRKQRPNYISQLQKLIELRRLTKVGIRSKFVDACLLRLQCRGGRYDDDCFLTPWATSHVFKYFRSAQLRQI